MKQTKLLIIGCGRIGKMHLDNVLTHFPEVSITGVIDEHLDLSWVQQRNIQRYDKSELNVLLAEPALDAVLIAASSAAHYDLVEAAAMAGKHIFCEKPVSFDPKQFDSIIDLVASNNVKLQIGLNRRFDKDFLRVKSIVDAGEIGDIHIIKITNRDPKRPDVKFIPRSGGLFFDFNVHDFDMARFISSAEIEEVYAMGANLIDPEIGKLGDIDTAIISMKLSNGAHCIIDSSRETHYGYDQRLEVFGSKGNIKAQNTQATNTLFATASHVEVDTLHHSFIERYADAYLQQIKAFFTSINQDKPVAVTANDMKQAVLAAHAASESMNTGTVSSLDTIHSSFTRR